MTPTVVLRIVLRILAPLCVLLTTYLYLYPVFLGCAFPLPPKGGDGQNGDRLQPTNSISSAAFHSTIQQHLNASYPDRAPFRLLALGDPQLEGDSSIPNYGFNPFWHLEWSFKHLTFRTTQPNFRLRMKQAVHDIVDFFLDDIPLALESLRKRIDLWGNDYYLAHIYRTLRWWTKPTHVTVLGDLLGSQWVSDEEFERRSWRFWNRSFMGAERVPDDIALPPAEEYELAGLLGNDYENDDNAAAWRRRLINVVGNHDIGYAGDITQDRIARFERAFGKTGYELRFELPVTNETSNATIYDKMTNPSSNRLVPELRLVVINNMNLDTPAADQSLQDKSYGFLNSAISTGSSVEFKGHFTIVLTHIPMYKPAGICVDAPFFDFFEDTGGVKEQNQLSPDASKGFLEGIYGLSGNQYAPGGGMGRRGVILNGHDHEGCDTWHWINQTVEIPVAEVPVVEPLDVVDVPAGAAHAAAGEEAEGHMEGVPLLEHPIRGISLRAQGLSEDSAGHGETEVDQLVDSNQPKEQDIVKDQKRQSEEQELQVQKQDQQTEAEQQGFQVEQRQQQDNDAGNEVTDEQQQKLHGPQSEEQQVEEQKVEETQAEENQHEEKHTEQESELEMLPVTDAIEQPIAHEQQIDGEQKTGLQQDDEQHEGEQVQDQAQTLDQKSEDYPQVQPQGQLLEHGQDEHPQEQQYEEQRAQDENQQTHNEQPEQQESQPEVHHSEPQQPPPPPPPEPPKPEWKTSIYSSALSSKLTSAPKVPGIRELTVRSMMGDFGGNAGLLSAWFDEEDWEWKFEFVTCALGRQYMWWFVHSCDFALVFLGLVYAVLRACLQSGIWREDKWPESWVRWVEGKKREWFETVESVKALFGQKVQMTAGSKQKVEGAVVAIKEEMEGAKRNGAGKLKTERVSE